MKLIFCIDDKKGMMFFGKRQSQDIINIAIKTMFDFDDDIDLTFYSKDAKYYDMLTMFKEIKKRGYR